MTVIDDDGAVANHSINVTVRIDSDGDGMPDVWEILHGLAHLDPTGDNAADGDPDEDFLVNLQEYYYGLHPWDDDTDDDGILDGIEDLNRNGIVDTGETDPLNDDTDGDGLNDGLEIGLNVAQGGDTAEFWQNDWDPLTKTDPLDADTDDDGIIDANEERININGIVDPGETDPREWDTDNDYLPDGLEIGLTEPQHNDTNINLFWADSDPSTTTDPNDPDSDDDGLLDGVEDNNHNGSVDATEPDPNNWDSEGDGLADGSGNTATILTLTHIDNADLVNAHDVHAWANGHAIPHAGYRVPAVGKWTVPANGTLFLDETISVAFFLNNLPMTIYDGSEVNYTWLPDVTGLFNITNGDLTLYFDSTITDYAFADPDPAEEDADNDTFNDYAEALYLSGRMADFRYNNTDNDTINRTLLDGTTIFNNLIDPDSDNDGVLDGDEWANNSDMLVVDTEGDGLTDFQELKIYYTNPCDPDTDWDGLSDYEEVYLGLDNNYTNATNPDTDNDGLYDGWVDSNHNLTYDIGEDWGEHGDLAQFIVSENRNEGGYGTNATLNDTDFDGLDDGVEVDFWQEVWDITDLAGNALTNVKWNSHCDNDGIINLLDPDSDNDGILDGPEKTAWENYANITSPGWQNDHDGDKLINIIDPDSDDEGLEDGEEMLIYGTRPDKWDTDGDGAWSYYIWPSTHHKDVFNDLAEINYWKAAPHNLNNIVAGLYATQYDTDGDGLMDGWEAHYGLGPNDDGTIDESTAGALDGPNGALGDPDHDGLTNIQEYIYTDLDQYNLFPTDEDTDGDGLYDGFNDANGDGIWNDYGEDGVASTDDFGEGDGLWQDGEEAWGEIGDLDTPTSYGFAGGYGLTANNYDTDGDRFEGEFKDGAEVGYWLDHNCNSIVAGQRADTRDVDRDGCRDGWEYYWNYDPDNPSDGYNYDPDDDKMDNAEEEDGWYVKNDGFSRYRVYSDPRLANKDGDSLDDKAEKNSGDDTGGSPGYGTDPNEEDTDGDDLNDGEASWNTNALDRDTDDDALWDGDETSTSIDLDPYSAIVTTNPTLFDSDGDGLWDGDEQQLVERDGYPNTYYTSPNNEDYDSDGLWDGDELDLSIDKDPYESTVTTNPRKEDTDDDGLYDGDEQLLVDIDSLPNLYLTDPNDPHTDDDGIKDGTEVGIEKNAWTYNFENSETSFYPLKTWSTTGLWQRSNSRAYSGSWSYHCGHSATTSESYLISKTIHLPDTEGLNLKYWCWMDLHASDIVAMGVRTIGGDYIGNTYVRGTITQSTWVEVTLDVSSFRGQDVKLEFYYNGYQGTTGHQGWYADYVRLDGVLNPTIEDTDGDGLWDGYTCTVGGVVHEGELDPIFDTNQLHNDTDWDLWGDSEEHFTYKTSPTEKDSDSDGVYDSIDLDPLFDLDVMLRITDIMQLDDVDSDGDFYIWAACSHSNGVDWQKSAEPMASNSKIVQPNYEFIFDNVPDTDEEVLIIITLWDDDGGIENSLQESIDSDDDICDISGGAGGGDENDIYSNAPFLSYSLKTGTWSSWQGDEFSGDGNGYGHVSGNSDGSTGTDEDDCELWFDIYQSDFIDGDGMTYWEEIYVYNSDPTIDNYADNWDGDNMPSGWEDRHGLNPLDDDSMLDRDGDRIPNGWEFELGKDPNNPLDVCSFELTISLNWDADAAYFNDYIAGMRAASNYLFEATDGYFFIRDINVFDQSTSWNVADIRVGQGLADDNGDGFWPHSSIGTSGHIYMPQQFDSSGNGGTPAGIISDPDDPDYFRTIIHEFGHYAFYMYDEYLDSGGNVIPWGNRMQFVMSNQYTRDEFSTLDDYVNAAAGINTDTKQWDKNGESCWETLFDKYNYFSGDHENAVQFDLDANGIIDTTYFNNFVSGTFAAPYDMGQFMTFFSINF